MICLSLNVAFPQHMIPDLRLNVVQRVIVHTLKGLSMLTSNNGTLLQWRMQKIQWAGDYFQKWVQKFSNFCFLLKLC